MGKIEKDDVTLMCELINGLQIMKDCIKMYHQDRTYHILPISVQLRALLVDKDQSFLFRLLNKTGESDKVWYRPKHENKIDGLLFSFDRLNATTFKKFYNQILISLEELICEPVIDIAGIVPKIIDGVEQPISLKLLIKSYADTAGGAHYDSKCEEYLLYAWYFGKDLVDSLLIDLAELVIELGVKILNCLGCLDLYILLAVNSKQNIHTYGCIFEYRMPNSNMMFALLVDNEFKLHFICKDINGRHFCVISEEVIDWNVPHVVNITYSITKELNTCLEIYLDDKSYGKTIIERPIFILADPFYYNGYLNNNINNVEQIGFGFDKFRMFSRKLENDEKNSMLNEMKDSLQNELNCILFDKNTFAIKNCGERDLQLNETKKGNLYKIAAGEI